MIKSNALRSSKDNLSESIKVPPAALINVTNVRISRLFRVHNLNASLSCCEGSLTIRQSGSSRIYSAVKYLLSTCFATSFNELHFSKISSLTLKQSAYPAEAPSGLVQESSIVSSVTALRNVRIIVQKLFNPLNPCFL